MLENDLIGRYITASDWVEDAERFVREMTLIANSLQTDIDVETEVDVRLKSAWVTAEIQREALKFISVSITEECGCLHRNDNLTCSFGSTEWPKCVLLATGSCRAG